MVDEPPFPTPAVETSPGYAGGSPRPHYDLLRWAIRITGIILMFGGTIYLGVTASRLLIDLKSGETLFFVVGSLLALGLGIFVLRIGYAMLKSINSRTIGNFSFLFALIYTFILIQILPSTDAVDGHSILIYFCVILYFGLSYWALKSILFRLLLSRPVQ